jgi:hypothetical protein
MFTPKSLQKKLPPTLMETGTRSDCSKAKAASSRRADCSMRSW